jgi:predicted ATP-grasp superfamily ATP-dependent carboligase
MGYSGLGIVRSLGRRGIPVFTLDPNLGEIGMSSRFATARQCPAIEKSKEQNLDFLVGLARLLPEKPVLYPTSDNVVHGYAAREDVLKPYIRLTTPSTEIIRKTAAKDALFHTARETGIPVPETFVPKSLDEVRAISAEIPYPCLIKPVRSNSWHREAVQKKLKEISGGSEKSILIKTPEELIAAYLYIAEVDADVIVTEVIPGDDCDLLYFAFYRSSDGRVWHISGRKERVTPVHFGSASYVVSIQDPILERVSIDFIERLNYQGLGGIEFKRDSRDGKLKLIELNTRFGLWDALGQRCGVDTAYIAYLDAIGEKLPQPQQARAGVKWVSISRDFGAFRGYRREGALRTRDWLHTFAGEKMWAVFAWDDPMPAVTATLRFSRRAFGYVARGFWSRRAQEAA